MTIKPTIFYFFCLCFFSPFVFSAAPPVPQAMITKVIDLHYSQAQKIIPLIQPLLHPGEVVSGSGQTLVVKVSPQTLTQLRLILNKLDAAPVTFKIEVYQGYPDWLNSQDDGGTVSYGTTGKDTQRQSQSVNVLNGNSAFVSTGENVPVVSSVGNGLFTNGVSYQQLNASTGIMIKPQLEGSKVRLAIKRLRQQVNPTNDQQINTQQIDTTMMVPLEKWVSMGSAEGADADESSTTVSYEAGNKFNHNATLFIKVSVIDQ